MHNYGQMEETLQPTTANVLNVVATKRARITQGGAETNYWPGCNKNSSGDETANVNFYAVRPDATRIR